MNSKLSYSNRILKGGALLEDMRHFVRVYDGRSRGAATINEFIVQTLSKKTIARAHDVYANCIAPRLIHGDPPESWRFLQPLEKRGLPPQVIKPLYYWVTARSERILYDFVQEELWYRLRSADRLVTPKDTILWVKRKCFEHGLKWSPSVIERVAQGILAALRDFGILEGAVKKHIAAPYLPLESFSYIAYLLFAQNYSGARLLNHADWNLFLLTPATVEGLFLAAHQKKYLRYESAGNIARTDFPAKSVEEIVDALA